MKVLSLGGAGAVCEHATRDLAAYSDFEEIVIGEYDRPAAEKLAADIGDPRLRVLYVDAADEERLVEIFRDFDFVLNGLPFKYDLAVTRACVEAGVSGLDVSTEESQWDYDETARQKEMIFIPGMGATPGTTNAMARRGASLLDEIDEIQVNFAAFRCLAPSPGLLTTTLWEFRPDEEDRLYYRDGDFHWVGPFEGLKTVRFHEHIGEQVVCYIPHSETRTLPKTLGAKAASVHGCFPPHVMNLMKTMLDAGLYGEQLITMQSQATTPLAVMAELLTQLPESKRNPVWAYGLVVDVFGRRNGRRAKVHLWNSHPSQDEWDGQAAYYRNIGIPLSIGVQMMADGRIAARGVVPPEAAVPPEPFFDELRRRGIEIHEELTVLEP